MARILDVYLHQQLVGQLVQDDHGQMLFDYADAWLANKSATPLSQSLPLHKERFTRNECRAFFAGVLPEEEKREVIARNLGISAKNDFALLEKLGGECAGAVTFLPKDQPFPINLHEYRPLNDQQLAKILKSLPRRPLMAGDEEIRLSLAGAQDKIAVFVSGKSISLPLNGAPSTHILKPAIERFAGVVFNEAFCMKLASAVNIASAEVEIRSVEGIDYLLVKRYDRTKVAENKIQRLHQEDFCQALGIVPEMKYQAEGGPGLKQCFELLRLVSSTPVIELQQLLDAVIFNFIIGNNDAHGKNFSLLYQDQTVKLAPLYDLICTAYYPELSNKMAMKLGGEAQFEKITPAHFEKLAKESTMAASLIKQRVVEVATMVVDALDTIELANPIVGEIAALIKVRCKKVIDRF